MTTPSSSHRARKRPWLAALAAVASLSVMSTTTAVASVAPGSGEPAAGVESADVSEPQRPDDAQLAEAQRRVDDGEASVSEITRLIAQR